MYRLVFWNAGGLGWSIGKNEYLKTGSYWHKSGTDSAEPWQTDWEKEVQVECLNQTPKEDIELKGEHFLCKIFVIYHSILVIDCLWSGYSDWSECSVTCGKGSQSRTRKVLQQSSTGGKDCDGEAVETISCDGPVQCLLDCGSDQFSSWGQCSVSCGVGVKIRQRRVVKNNIDGSQECQDDVQEEICEMQECELETTTLQIGKQSLIFTYI